MTAFLAIMPINASTPRMATKPSGRLNSSSDSTTPMSPSGMMATTMASRRKLTSWNIMMISISPIISGRTANTEARETALSSYRPPVATLYCAGSLAANSSILGARSPTTESASTPGVTSARTVSVGTRSRRQTSGNSCSSVKVANCRNGTMRPLGVATCSELSDSNEARSASVARATTLIR